jgi:hypothetical protein
MAVSLRRKALSSARGGGRGMLLIGFLFCYTSALLPISHNFRAKDPLSIILLFRLRVQVPHPQDLYPSDRDASLPPPHRHCTIMKDSQHPADYSLSVRQLIRRLLSETEIICLVFNKRTVFSIPSLCKRRKQATVIP